MLGLIPGIPIAVAAWSSVGHADRDSAPEGDISPLAIAVASGLLVETTLLSLGVGMNLEGLTPSFAALALATAFVFVLSGAVLRWAPPDQTADTFRGWQVIALVANVGFALLAVWFALGRIGSIDPLAWIAVALMLVLIAAGQWHFLHAPRLTARIPA
jgi:hypothetical protein